MGVPITAAALLETILVIIAMMSINALMMAGVGSDWVTKTKAFAKKSEPPVTSRAFPRHRLATISIMMGMFMASPTSFHLRDLVTNSAANPTRALIEMGINPVPAATATPSIMYKGKAVLLWGIRSVDPSMMSKLALVLRLFMASSVPCTKSTSPTLSCFDVMSPTTSEPVRLRCIANGSKLKRWLNF